MLSVTFSQPIVIDASLLHNLLSLANAPATVEAYMNGHATPTADPVPVAEPAKRGRKPKANGVVITTAPVDGELVHIGDRPKRTRRTKAEMAAARAAEQAASGVEAPAQTTEAETAGTTTETPEAALTQVAKKPGRKPKAKETETATAATVEAAEVASTGGLLERFAKLIDSDFAQAKAVLDHFGVNRFSDLKSENIAAFAAKLVELGV